MHKKNEALVRIHSRDDMREGVSLRFSLAAFVCILPKASVCDCVDSLIVDLMIYFVLTCRSRCDNIPT